MNNLSTPVIEFIVVASGFIAAIMMLIAIILAHWDKGELWSIYAVSGVVASPIGSNQTIPHCVGSDG